MLQNEKITARLSGQYLSVWSCTTIRMYELCPLSNTNCYNEVPISYTNNGHMYNAFLNLAELEIVPYAKVIDCKHVTSRYVQTSRHRTANWNGKNFTYVDLHVYDIVLMTANPKSREFHLMASKIMDPHQEKFDRLTRLLDVENSIRALTKLLELTATAADIDPAELKYLAQSAGIESVNFVLSILSKTVNFFTPPKWLIILCMVILILILSLIIICCFPNCVQACIMTL